MKAFLSAAGWDDAAHAPLPGDASARQYTRLTKADQSAMLMQDSDGDVALFASLARYLTGIGLSAPRVYAEDAAAGLLLIEDFGDGLIARLATDAKTERALYLTATDALIALHRHQPPKNLPKADAPTLAQMTDLAFTQYADRPDVAARCATLFEPILRRHAMPADVMVLRDYHADNILDLPDRGGAARAGLLDFQDAMQGHRAYDLVSLVEDARRDVRPETRAACIAHYIAATGQDAETFHASLAVLGTQRNLRILGVFARLAKCRGKPHYIDMIPRAWAHLQSDLEHPALASVSALLNDTLPAPTPALMESLKTKCQTP